MIRVAALCLLLAGCAAVESPPAAAQTTPLNFPQTTDPSSQSAVVVTRAEDFPCLTCLAWTSLGGGTAPRTSSLLDLHVQSSGSDVAFPRALVTRIESACANCEPTAFVAHAEGQNPAVSIWAANLEAYSQGRATVAELNMGAAGGGYMLNLIPTRMPSGPPSRVDAILNVEGKDHDPTASQVNTVLDVRLRPTAAVVRFDTGLGATNVLASLDGRAQEQWYQDADGGPHIKFVLDGVTVWQDGATTDLVSRVALLEAQVNALRVKVGN